MLVKEIYQEVREITGNCEESVVFNAITRGIKLLAARSLCDPLLGYLRFTADNGYLIALPREVHSVLKVNIDNTPAFFRSSIFEFQHNSEGSNDGESIGFSWADRLTACIQDERKLPGLLKYICTAVPDIGKTARVIGRDSSGREIEETLTADLTPVAGVKTFAQITNIVREATTAPCLLHCNDQLCGQYYKDEINPSYKVLKLSKTGVSVRLMFRRKTWAITSQEDIIPMDSEDAVIMAAKAVRARQADELEKYAMFLEEAVKTAESEEAAQKKAKELAEATQVGTAIDFSIYARDSVVAGDVYDVAADIFGPVGKHKLMDRITDAVETLRNKAFWDAGVGFVNIWTSDRTGRVHTTSTESDGRFTLPRFVETPISLNYDHRPTIPRNRWYEFHINGFGSTANSIPGSWDDCGETVLRQEIRLDPVSKEPIPIQFMAVCEEATDAGAYIRIYGRELINGVVRDVWRDGAEGWLCPCVTAVSTIPLDTPWFVQVDRIERRLTKGFVRLVEAVQTVEPIPAHQGFMDVSPSYDNIMGPDYSITLGIPIRRSILPGEAIRIEKPGDWIFNGVVTYTVGDWQTESGIYLVYLNENPNVSDPANPLPVQVYEDIPAIPAQYVAGDVYGHWYPDETEPKYRSIRIKTARVQMIRLMYRRRTVKITSLYQPLHLRSRRAVELVMRAASITETGDVNAGELLEQKAVRLLAEERINETPSDTPSLQFDPGTMPGWGGNIQ